MHNDQSRPNGTRAGAEVPCGIDLDELLAFLRARLGMVAAILLACEALIVAASLLVTPEFRAESLVRMAKIAEIQGEQGLILEKTRERLAAQPVILAPRAAQNTVLITATGGTPEEAAALAEQATEALIEEGRKVVEDYLRIPQALQAIREDAIAQLDADIRGLFPGESVGREADQLLAMTRGAAMEQLFEARTRLYADLVQDKLKTQRDFSPPVRIDAPHAMPQQSRPRWGRNLLLGAGFGACFGAFVVVLLGVFRQLAVQPSR